MVYPTLPMTRAWCHIETKLGLPLYVCLMFMQQEVKIGNYIFAVIRLIINEGQGVKCISRFTSLGVEIVK
jgi:hypothetical protein